MVQLAGSSEVYILDPDSKRIATAQKEHPNLKTCVSGSESIPYENGFFDKAYSTLAVHHFTDQEKSFREIGRVLKPGGTLVIVDINPKSLLGGVVRFFEKTIMRAHLHFLKLEELVAMLGNMEGLVVRESQEGGPGYFVLAVKIP